MVNAVRKRQKNDQQWGLLGDIEIEVTTAPRRFRHEEGSKLVEIEKIGEKPGLQHTGEELQEITWDFRFHAGWCDPEEQLQEVQKAHREKKPLTLVFGKTVIKGNYVIESISTTVSRTDLKGRLVEIEMNVKLKETASKVSKKKSLFKSPFKTRK